MRRSRRHRDRYESSSRERPASAVDRSFAV